MAGVIIMKDTLIQATISRKNDIPYINLDENNKYRGWISNFGFYLPNGERMKLNLSNDSDLFLLFVLASSWSKTGPWENAAFFTACLKHSKLDEFSFWIDKNELKKNKIIIENELQRFLKECNGLIPRKKVSFRSDFYDSLVVLAENWMTIKEKLSESEKNNNYFLFIDYISQLHGLGSGNNRMKIKIPLILRELRCQNTYKNIDGKLCCVADARVIEASYYLGIKLPLITSLKSVFKASEIIYENFGDLYDIPLFAYEDVKNFM